MTMLDALIYALAILGASLVALCLVFLIGLMGWALYGIVGDMVYDLLNRNRKDEGDDEHGPYA